MKVIQILPELNSGGVERGTLEVGKHLVEQGHESLVISNGGRLVEQLEREGSQHITLPVHKKSLRSLSQVKVLRQLFEKEAPDIIHLRSRLPAWLAYLAWRKMPSETRPRLVTTVHGFYSVNGYSAIMTKGERVICVSNSVRDYVLENYPKVTKEKLAVIHRGVDPKLYPRNYQPDNEWRSQWENDMPQLSGKYVVLMPGRITGWKGSLDFLDVIDQIKCSGIPVHGLLVGETHPKKQDFLEKLKRKIEDQKLGEDVSILSHRSDLREIMSISDCIVSCSTAPEAFGRVTLEALTLGKPVAGYDHGGVHEQLDEMATTKEAYIPVGDADAMAKSLISWKARPPEIRPNQNLTLEQMLVATINTYTELNESSRCRK